MELMWTVKHLDFFFQIIISSFLEAHHISVPDETHLFAARWR